MRSDKDMEELTDDVALVAMGLSLSEEKSPSPAVSLPGAFPSGGTAESLSPPHDDNHDEADVVVDEEAPVATLVIPESLPIAATVVDIDEPYTATTVIEAEPMEPKLYNSCCGRWWILRISLVVIVAIVAGVILGLRQKTTTTASSDEQLQVGIPSDYAHRAYYAVLWVTNTSCDFYEHEPLLNLSCSDTIFVTESVSSCHRTAAGELTCTKPSDMATFVVTCASNRQDQSLALNATLPRENVLDCSGISEFESGGFATSAVTVAVADATCSAFTSAPLICLQGSFVPLRNGYNISGSGAFCADFGACQPPPRCTNDCSCEFLVEEVQAQTAAIGEVGSDCSSSSDVPSLVSTWQKSLPVRDFALRPPNNNNDTVNGNNDYRNGNGGTNPSTGGQ